MGLILGNNVDGGLSTGENFHIGTDTRGKTYAVYLFRDNSTLMIRFLMKSEFTLVSGRTFSIPTLGLTAQCDPAIITALTATDGPEGVANQWSGGAASNYVAAITNLNYVPLKFSAPGSVTIASINESTGIGFPSNPNAVKKIFAAKANPDGTVTVSDIQLGDVIVIDGGTGVAATETTFTSGTLKDGSHTVAVTAKSTAIYYAPASVSVTTKIQLLSAPVDFIKENPLLSGAIGIGFILLIVYVLIPLLNREPIFGGMLEGKSEKRGKIVSLKNKRRKMSLAA